MLLAAATVALAFVAAFQDRIRSWLRQPRLDVTISVAPPDCHKTELRGRTVSGQVIGAECYYFRLRVKNVGNERAEFVEVFAADLSRCQADGAYKKVTSFLPMNLVWSHILAPYTPAISPGMEKHCDLFHITYPAKRARFGAEDDPGFSSGSPQQTLLNFDVEVKPNTLGFLVPPGEYRLVVVVGAANSRPKQQVLEINHTGKWFADQETMLTQGIGIRVV
jgi:hypothetical protein